MSIESPQLPSAHFPRRCSGTLGTAQFVNYGPCFICLFFILVWCLFLPGTQSRTAHYTSHPVAPLGRDGLRLLCVDDLYSFEECQPGILWNDPVGICLMFSSWLDWGHGFGRTTVVKCYFLASCQGCLLSTWHHCVTLTTWLRPWHLAEAVLVSPPPWSWLMFPLSTVAQACQTQRPTRAKYTRWKCMRAAKIQKLPFS